MAITKIITDVPKNRLNGLMKSLQDEGYDSVVSAPQPDGKFKVTAKGDNALAQARIDAAPPLPRRPIPDFVGRATPIKEADFKRAAEAIGCDVAAVKAVSEVESAGAGFLADKRPKILFEAHVFGRRTGHVYNKSHPNISSAKWDRSLYGSGGAHQYKRLEQAMALDRNAALASASWGRFQIMGFNFETCGFGSVTAFVSAMVESEGRQLDAFVGYIKGRRLDDELRRHDWAAFAAAYNGPAFAENSYDTKMAAAWARHSKGDWLTPRQVQAALNRAGADPALVVDGAIGAKSRKAIRAFQKARGMEQDGRITPALVGALLKV